METNPVPDVSIILPVYNEEENLPILFQQIFAVLNNLEQEFEVISVDDGSSDGSYKVLQELAQKEPRIKVISFRRNFGQTAAISAGIDNSRGEIIILMDSDLQNDAKDIPRLLKKLDEGFDVVSGWRKNRYDAALKRKLPSAIANRIISFVTGVHLHDYGCTLKAYRRGVFSQARLYGEMHRFIPAYAYWAGAKITEMEVTHHPRIYGKSKYGLGRIVKVLLDLTTVKFLSSYSTKPIYIFGGVGFVSMLGGILSGILVLYHKWFRKIYAHRNPFLLLALFLFLVGLLFLMLGLLAELLVRIWYESQGKTTYAIKDTVNINLPGSINRMLENGHYANSEISSNNQEFTTRAEN